MLPGGRRVKVRGVQVHGVKQPEALRGTARRSEPRRDRSATTSRAARAWPPPARSRRRAWPTPRGGAARREAAEARCARAVPSGHGGDSRTRRDYRRGRPSGGVATAQPRQCPAGGRAYVRLRLEQAAVLARGDRYILRAYSPSITIAGGYILDPKPPRAGVRSTGAARSMPPARFRSRKPQASGPPPICARQKR